MESQRIAKSHIEPFWNRRQNQITGSSLGASQLAKGFHAAMSLSTKDSRALYVIYKGSEDLRSVVSSVCMSFYVCVSCYPMLKCMMHEAGRS